MRDGGERILGLGRGGGLEGKVGGFPSGDAAGDFGDLGVAGALEQAGGDAGAVAAGAVDGGREVSAARLVWVSFFAALRMTGGWGWWLRCARVVWMRRRLGQKRRQAAALPRFSARRSRFEVAARGTLPRTLRRREILRRYAPLHDVIWTRRRGCRRGRLR
jgi:hypothetical protein